MARKKALSAADVAQIKRRRALLQQAVREHGTKRLAAEYRVSEKTILSALRCDRAYRCYRGLRP